MWPAICLPLYHPSGTNQYFCPNIPRYVDSGIEIEEIDLVAVKDKLDALREYSKQMETRLQAYYRELGL